MSAHTTTKNLSSWSALDVALVAAVAAVLQIRQFARFIIGDKCAPVDGALRRHGLDALLHLHGDDVCFDVDTKLERGSGWSPLGMSSSYIIIIHVIIIHHHTSSSYHHHHHPRRSVVLNGPI